MSFMTPITSSNIASVGHSAGTLYVRFHSGRTYLYDGVAPKVFEELLAAPSKGKYFCREIRPKYTGVQIDDDRAVS